MKKEQVVGQPPRSPRNGVERSCARCSDGVGDTLLDNAFGAFDQAWSDASMPIVKTSRYKKDNAYLSHVGSTDSSIDLYQVAP